MPPVRTIAFPCRGVLTAKHRAAAFPQCAFPFFLPIRKCYSPLTTRRTHGAFSYIAPPPAVFSCCSPAAPFCTSRLGNPCFPPAPPFNTFTRESFCSRFPRLSRSPRRVDFSAFAFGVLCFLRRRCFTAAKSAVKKGDGKNRAEWSACYRYSYVSPLPLCRVRLTPHYLMRRLSAP